MTGCMYWKMAIGIREREKLKENWYALFIASLLPVKSADEAFNLFYTGDKKYIKTRKTGIEMLLMQRQGYSNSDIAKMYKINKHTVDTRIHTARNIFPEEI